MTAGTARRLLGTGTNFRVALTVADRLGHEGVTDVLQALGILDYPSGQNLDAYCKRDWRGSLTHQPRPTPDPLSTAELAESTGDEPSTERRGDARSTGCETKPPGMHQHGEDCAVWLPHEGVWRHVEALPGEVAGVVLDAPAARYRPVPVQALATSREARDKAADARLDDVERLVERVQRYRDAAEAAELQYATEGA